MACMKAWIILAFLAVAISATESSDSSSENGKYIFTTIRVEPYLRYTEEEIAEGNDRFEGFIPAFLKELRDRGAIPDYSLQLVDDGNIGYYDEEQDRWVGMIGEVIKQGSSQEPAADLAAGPISAHEAMKDIIDFSKVWANVSLSVITHKDNSLETLQDVIDSPLTLGGVEGGSSLEAIQSTPEAPYINMWSKIESDPDSKVPYLMEGIKRTREGNYSLILENQLAEYLVNQYCELMIVDSFLPQSGYAFALPLGSHLTPELDKGIQSMIDDGTLQRLHREHWSVPCVSGQSTLVSQVSLLAFLLLLAIFNLGQV